jgi:hypothetical protein
MVTGHGTLAGNSRADLRWPALAGGRPRGQALISCGMRVSDSAGREVAESEREVLLYLRTRVRDAAVRVSAGLTAEQQRTPCAVRDQPARPHQAPDRGRGALVPAGLPRPGPRHRPVHDRAPSATSDQVVAACRPARARSNEIVRPAPICPPSPPSPSPAYPAGLAETDHDAHDRGDRTARRSRRHPAEQIDGATGL